MNQSDLTILVVDDVNAIRTEFKQMLIEFGYRHILTADSGISAITLLKDHNVDLVLSDWHMSPLDGMDLLSFTKSHMTKAPRAFIMATAEANPEKVIYAIQQGVDGYLIKPVDKAHVQKKVQEILTRKGVLT